MRGDRDWQLMFRVKQIQMSVPVVFHMVECTYLNAISDFALRSTPTYNTHQIWQNKTDKTKKLPFENKFKNSPAKNCS